jgi:hypothetical protein
MEYQFEGVLTVKDYLRLGRRGAQKRTVVIAICFYLIAIGLNFYPYPIETLKWILEDPSRLLLLPMRLHVLFGTAAFLFSIFVLEPLVYKRVYKSDKLAGKLRAYKITEETIAQSTDISSISITKNEVHKIWLAKDRMYILYSAVSAIVIKEAFFNSKEEYEEVKTFIIKNFEKKRHHKPDAPLSN